jgi:hypothetical protein
VAVLESNITACHLKLQQWQLAVDCATEALNRLNQLILAIPMDDFASQAKVLPSISTKETESSTSDPSGLLISHGVRVERNSMAEIELSSLAGRGILKHHIDKVKSKVLLRRAKGREGLCTWVALQAAEEGRISGIAWITIDTNHRQITSSCFLYRLRQSTATMLLAHSQSCPQCSKKQRKKIWKR